MERYSVGMRVTGRNKEKNTGTICRITQLNGVEYGVCMDDEPSSVYHTLTEEELETLFVITQACGAETIKSPFHEERTRIVNDFIYFKDPQMTLPIDSKQRKDYPLLRGCLRYFPAALAGVTKISKEGNDKHNPGEELHHARGKSADHADCIVRHLMDIQDLLAAKERGALDNHKMLLTEVSQLAWRALAYSQELHEAAGYPLAPGAKKDGESK